MLAGTWITLLSLSGVGAAASRRAASPSSLAFLDLDEFDPVAAVKGDTPLPVDGILTESAILPILLSGGALSNGQFINIEVAVDATNTTAQDLVDDINTAIVATRLSGLVQARLEDGAHGT